MDQVRKVLSILSPQEHRRLLVALVAMIVSGLVDMVGVFSIVPFLTAAVDPEGIAEVGYLNWAYKYFEFSDEKKFLLALALFSFCALVINNAVRWLMRLVNLNVSTRMWHDVNVRMFQHYLEQPYSYYLNRNSAELIDKIMMRVNAIVAGLIQPGLFIITNVLTGGLLFLLLLWQDLGLTIIIFTLLTIFYLTVYRQVQIRMDHYGKVHTQLGPNLLKLANEAFGGIKELKTLGRERFFIREFVGFSHLYSDTSKKHQITQMTPPGLIEVAALGTILLMGSYLILTHDNYGEVLPVIGVYVISFRRIQPAVQEIFTQLSHIRYWRASFYAIWPDVEQAFSQPPGPLGDEEVVDRFELQHGLEIDKVEYIYENADVRVLNGVDLRVSALTKIGIVGGSGVGKTTLVDILLGLLEPSAGQILVDGRELGEIDRKIWSRNVGYVPQHVFLADDTVTRNIAFGIEEDKIDIERVNEAAKLAQIHRFVEEELPDKYDTHIGERGIRLSGGQRQRMGIARALYDDPTILVLDEATSALDGITEQDFMQAIRGLSNEKTILIIAHRLTTIKDCDTIFLLEKGRVVDHGTYDQLLLNNETFANMAKMSQTSA